MKRIFVLIISILLCTTMASAANTQVIMKTSMGAITIELFDDKAPVTVKNFLRYVDEGFYNGTIFHRVISNFMIQGGGMVPGLRQKKTHNPIPNEANNGIPNQRGTLAMARTNAPHSATAQFFINVTNNTFLNFRDTSTRGYGYCVFGRVIQGMDVVDKIRGVKTGNVGPFGDVLVKVVVIISVKRK